MHTDAQFDRLGGANVKKLPVLFACVVASLMMLPGATAAGPIGVTCGDTIGAPGDYYLSDDCTGAGITIAASQVHLKFNGHTMTGSGSCCGLFASAVSKLHIEGPGTITRYQIGIQFGFDAGVDDTHVEKLIVSDNSQYGVALQHSHHDEFNDVVATRNGDIGFVQNFDSTDIRYDNDTASHNGHNGISIAGPGFSSTTQINNSTVEFNGNNGIDIGGGTGQSRLHINGNRVNGNGITGIFFSGEGGATDNYIDGNTVNTNGRFGITLRTGATDNHLHGNTALGNGVPGGLDLRDDNLDCDGNNWEGNHFATANQSCIH